jgi:O-antigen ligase
MRILGQTKWNDNTSVSGEFDYNKVSSGRFDIWYSSINNLFVNNNFFEIVFGITEPELQSRNKKSINLSIFSHNGFIDSFVTNGIIGFVLLFMFLKGWYKFLNQIKFKKNRKLPEFRYGISVFIVYIITLIFQGGVIVYDGFFISMSLILIIKLKNDMR